MAHLYIFVFYSHYVSLYIPMNFHPFGQCFMMLKTVVKCPPPLSRNSCLPFSNLGKHGIHHHGRIKVGSSPATPSDSPRKVRLVHIVSLADAPNPLWRIVPPPPVSHHRQGGANATDEGYFCQGRLLRPPQTDGWARVFSRINCYPRTLFPPKHPLVTSIRGVCICGCLDVWQLWHILVSAEK